MRVLNLDLGSPATGADGIPVAIAATLDALRARGVEATLERSDRPGLAGGLAAARALVARLDRLAPDVVHLHSAYRPAHVRVAAALRRRGIPYVVSPHSAFAAPALARERTRKRAFIAAFERPCLHAAACVLCLSDVEADDVRAVAPRARVAVVPNAVAPRAPVARPPAPGPPLLLALTRLDVRQKGLDRLAAVARHAPALAVRVHGDPDRNEPDALARLIAGLPPNVALLPPVRGAEKEAALAAATAYVALSRWEGLSMSVLEALAGGLPCVVSGYVARTVGEEAQDALLVLPDALLDRDPPAAAARIGEELADPAGLAARAARGRALVDRRFAPDAVARGLAAVYADAAGRA